MKKVLLFLVPLILLLPHAALAASPALQSVTTATHTGGSVSCNKPASLAVGDLMVGFASALIGAGSVTGPSGWTLVTTDTQFSLPAGIWYRVATSADVSAVSFTFTSTATVGTECAIERITGAAAVSPVDQFNSAVNNSATNLTTGGITPTKANSLLIEFVPWYRNAASASTLTVGSWAVTTSNPASWSTDANFNFDTDGAANDWIGIGLGSASRPQTTATGNATASLSAINDQGKMFIINVIPATTAAFAPWQFDDF